MAMKHLTTVMPLLVFAAAANISTALSMPSSGSPHLMIIAPPPAGIAALSDGTARLILAEDNTRRGAQERPRSGGTPAPQQPATEPAAPEENRDLDRRASPEASNDLFQLLKQAGPKQGSKPK
jgi:hypothetical protein